MGVKEQSGDVPITSRDSLPLWVNLATGLVLFPLFAYGFFDAGVRHSQQGGIDGLGVIFLALPSTQLAFVIGGGLAATIAGRTTLCLRWCSVSLVSFVFFDFLVTILYIYAYGIV